MAKKPDLDEPTLRIMERMVNMPPKRHEEMKIGKPKPVKKLGKWKPTKTDKSR